MNKEQQQTDERLRMDSVILTSAMIEEISFLQTGGNAEEHVFTKEDFNNCYIEHQKESITELMDFLIMLSAGNEPFDNLDYLKHLEILVHMKCHFDRLKSPID